MGLYNQKVHTARSPALESGASNASEHDLNIGKSGTRQHRVGFLEAAEGESYRRSDAGLGVYDSGCEGVCSRA